MVKPYLKWAGAKSVKAFCFKLRFSFQLESCCAAHTNTTFHFETSHQPVLLEVTESVCEARRWGNGASRPGMRLSTAISAFPFQRHKTAEQRRSKKLVHRIECRQKLSRQLSDIVSIPLIYRAATCARTWHLGIIFQLVHSNRREI